MLGWLKDVYKRHKKKIWFTGIFVGGTYIVSKYISWKLEEWQQAKILEFMQQTKKQYHFESNQRTCTMTFMSFLPNVRNAISEHMNIDELIEQLKGKPKNKLEIWEQLKILSMSHLVCSVITNVVLLVFLKVELNIVGGYMFVTSSNEDEQVKLNTQMNEIQVKYLNNVRYFIEAQMPCLIGNCIKAVEEVISPISLKGKISFGKLSQVIDEVKQKLFLMTSEPGNDKHAFCKYMVDPGWTCIDVNDLYDKMTSETVDVLESADCARVIDKCLVSGFAQVLDQLKNSFHGYEDPEAIVSVEECMTRDFFKPIDLPYAKVIPLLNGRIHEIYKAGTNEFLDAVFSESVLREFSSNIYDAFSKDYFRS